MTPGLGESPRGPDGGVGRPVALTVAASDSGGGAGVQADLHVFERLGVRGTSVVTALTAQARGVVHGVHPTPADFVDVQLAAILDAEQPRAAKTGVFVEAAAIERAAAKLRERAVPLVVDPVVRAGTGWRFLDDAAIEALRNHLIPAATLLTPNAVEAAILLGRDDSRASDWERGEREEAARGLRDLGADCVLITGGHSADAEGRVTDVLVDADGARWFESERIEAGTVHGTGCTLSAAVVAWLARGLPLDEAVARARELVSERIREARRSC